LVKLKLDKVLSAVHIIIYSSFRHNAPTTLGIQQKIEQTMPTFFLFNVLNVFYFCHVFNVF